MKKCPKCGKIYADSFITCKKDETPLVELGQKETARIMFRKKIAKFTVGFILFLVVIISGLKLFAAMENSYLKKGIGFLAKAEETRDVKLFEKNLKGAIGNLKRALFLNKINVFEVSKAGKICYILGKAYLLSDENVSAEECFINARKIFSDKDTYATPSELELKILQSLVSVNGIVGGNRAIVNDYMVKEGDLVKGIEVTKITDSYVMFNKGGVVFSSSVDKYNPIAKNLRMEYLETFQIVQQNENSGIARIEFRKLRDDVTRFLKLYMMDTSQKDEMQLLIDRCADQISLIDKEIETAKMQNRVIEGLSMDDVISVLGEPLSKHELFEMDADEKWVYGDKVLYFKDEDTEGNGLLISIEGVK